MSLARGQDEAFKGSGSAYGGEWKPKKLEDERLLGKPGEIKRQGDKETKIGPDGRAEKERHNTDHGQPWEHTNPHDHDITWSVGVPKFGSQQNYPDGAPEFKRYGEMTKMLRKNTHEENRFVSIDDFKWCMHCGGEVQFKMKGKVYSVCAKLQRPSDSLLQISISESYKQETERLYSTPDESLEYLIDGVRLRDIITDVEVIDRTI